MRLNKEAWGEITDLSEQDIKALFESKGFGKSKEILQKVDPGFGESLKDYTVIVEQRKLADIKIKAANEKHAQKLALEKAHELEYDHYEYYIFDTVKEDE